MSNHSFRLLYLVHTHTEEALCAVLPEGNVESEHGLEQELESTWRTEALSEAFKSGPPCRAHTAVTLR